MRSVLLLVLVLLGSLVIRRSPGSVDAASGVTRAVMSWGANDDGELGNDDAPNDRSEPGAVLKSGGGLLDAVLTISAGNDHAVALMADGTLWTWGHNSNGQLGNGDAPNGSAVAVQVLDPTGSKAFDRVVKVAAGSYHTLAIRDDGTLWAWGYDASGQLGDGNARSDQELPVQILNFDGSDVLTDVVEIAAGYDHSLAMTRDGAVYAWGSNEKGQSGVGLAGGSTGLPVRVLNATGSDPLGGVKALAAGSWSSFALATDGRVWSWGDNTFGQLGDGTRDPHPLPVMVRSLDGSGALTAVKEVAAGDSHVLATLNDGTPLSWGYNEHGQLGDGHMGITRDLPAPVVTVSGPLTGVITMAGGASHSLAVRSDGSAWSWGYDSAGQLGVGGGADRDKAAQVKAAGGFLTNVAEVATGVDGDTSYALGRTATATLRLPMATRMATVGVAVGGASVFGIDGYFIGESPVPPPAMSSEWKSTPPVAYTIQVPGDGVKTLYAFTRDTEGYVSPAAMARVRLDTRAPTSAFQIPSFTGGKRTKLKLSGADAGGIAGYLVKTNGTRPDPDAAGWKVRAPKSFPLSGADGPKKLYAWVRDKAGNVSATRSDTTLLDTEAPSVRINAPGRNAELERLRTISGRTVDADPASGVKRQRAAVRLKLGTSCSWWDAKEGKLVPGPCAKPMWFVVPATKRWEKEIGDLGTTGAYVLYVEAVDRALNRERATRRFTIVG